MLRITTTTGNELEWKIGQEQPYPTFIENISKIEANEEELEYIKKLFYNNTHRGYIVYTIPITDNLTMTWWGDIAKTIISNLNQQT